MKRLILIRHGETDYSVKRRYCGSQDIPLNTRGVRQSHRLKKRLKRSRIDEVYSSDLKRCLETACIVFGNTIVHKRKNLREIDFGLLAGLKYSDLKRKYPGIYKLWSEHPERLKMPGGESLPGFARRVERCFSGIARKNRGKNVAIVAHGGSIRIILLKLLKKDLGKMWEIEQSASALNVIDFAQGAPKISKINDTAHLRIRK
ncbi:MAG: hypothetical protein A2Z72_03920 [Omnitrophica bacterium RBG_13_46_9]|nr:MAG: hypothetical protein A2Z72_03920 [Omnitrophica bacterium RBG_13_46_9]